MMARKWFTLDNTSGLTVGDLSILNRAARLYQDAKRDSESLTHLELVILRTEYKPGMSAGALIEAANGQKY